jgi:DNA mismatch endonuclease, patch repair protein
LVDKVDKATRSRMMSAIKGKDTKPEIIVRRALHAAGFRFRLHDKKLPGKPDIVLAKYNTVIFVNGCFWHAHECPNFSWPKSRRKFWEKKLLGNRRRDCDVLVRLRDDGWKTIVIWECVLRRIANPKLDAIMSRIVRAISSRKSTVEFP